MNQNQKGVPGLLVIRESIGLQRQTIAKLLGLSQEWLRRIETGLSDCTQALQRRISTALCCTPADLLSNPTLSRLAEIRADYTQRVADEARIASERAVAS